MSVCYAKAAEDTLILAIFPVGVCLPVSLGMLIAAVKVMKAESKYIWRYLIYCFILLS
jgi:hypothetical protein